jgi:hypothetical protein
VIQHKPPGPQYQFQDEFGDINKETDGCRRDDGSFVEGGKTWALPNCRLGICAKSLTNGWEIATEG